jgi:pimeloyl-ACP methyl ester carboxylesterase
MAYRPRQDSKQRRVGQAGIKSELLESYVSTTGEAASFEIKFVFVVVLVSQPRLHKGRVIMKWLFLPAVFTTLAWASALHAQTLPSTSASTTFHRVQVDGIGIFYREAGPKDSPTIVLLHGFPSSSRMFDTLIPLLASRYHIIAPDYPGFGQSDAPSPAQYSYTFDHLAETTNRLLEQLKIDRFAVYMQDYGGPVGFRIMLHHPERVSAIIVQNANTYKEGLGVKWTGIAQYWENPKIHPEIFEAFSSFESVKQRHVAGSPHPERYNPDTWTDEYAFLSRPGQQKIQADLLYDYRTNVASYPQWQEWLRTRKPPMLVVWGKYDASFIVPGAQAYKRDVPQAEVHILDAGHFALDEKVDEIAALMLAFLAKQKF